MDDPLELKATSSQLSMASAHGIPLIQAHTINMKKAIQYLKYCATEECRLERYMNSLFMNTENRRKTEWM